MPTSVFGYLEYADQEWVSRVDGMIAEGQWSGKAAGEFHAEFLWKFHDTAAQQRSYARLLGVTVQVYHEAITNAYEVLHRIADTCLARLKGNYGSPGYDDAMDTLSVTSVITGALGLFPPLALPMGVIGLSTGIIQLVASPPTTTQR